LSLSFVSLIACRSGFCRHSVPFHLIKPVRRTRVANHCFAVSSGCFSGDNYREGGRKRQAKTDSSGSSVLRPQEQEAVEKTEKRRGGSGGCRYPSPGSRARRLTPRDSSGRFSGGGSRAEIIFRPPIGGRSQLTPERLRRRLCPATWTRSAGAHVRLCPGFPGMNRLRKRPAHAGALRLLDEKDRGQVLIVHCPSAQSASTTRTLQLPKAKTRGGSGEMRIVPPRPTSILERTRRFHAQVRSPGGPACPEGFWKSRAQRDSLRPDFV
jgi:hypothetical protein